MGAVTSITEAAWQDLLAYGKQMAWYQSPATETQHGLPSVKLSKLDAQGWEGCPMVWDAGIQSLRRVHLLCR